MIMRISMKVVIVMEMMVVIAYCVLISLQS